MQISRIDHFVLTVRDIAVTTAFYERVLGMQPLSFAGGRHALKFGRQKINLHQVGRELEPRAHLATAGSGDFCLITESPIDEVVAHLRAQNISIEEGPDTRSGALGPITSVYFRDPDNNLVEVSTYETT